MKILYESQARSWLNGLMDINERATVAMAKASNDMTADQWLVLQRISSTASGLIGSMMAVVVADAEFDQVTAADPVVVAAKAAE